MAIRLLLVYRIGTIRIGLIKNENGFKPIGFGSDKKNAAFNRELDLYDSSNGTEHKLCPFFTFKSTRNHSVDSFHSLNIHVYIFK